MDYEHQPTTPKVKFDDSLTIEIIEEQRRILKDFVDQKPENIRKRFLEGKQNVKDNYDLFHDHTGMPLFFVNGPQICTAGES